MGVSRCHSDDRKTRAKRTGVSNLFLSLKFLRFFIPLRYIQNDKYSRTLLRYIQNDKGDSSLRSE
ncbi:MAG: hypothetical protein Q4C98_10130 [Capnocytophaga sp.]|nr:hypothetical protein [Capnocytophaga sp.]